MERIAPSARLEAQIEELLHGELAADGEKLAELGWLGARLVLQRAVGDEVTAFLGRARYQRTAEATGSRNGARPQDGPDRRGRNRSSNSRSPVPSATTTWPRSLEMASPSEPRYLLFQ